MSIYTNISGKFLKMNMISVNADDNFRLKLSSKKLHSGRHQVKFEVKNAAQKRWYGYLLAEPEATFNDVLSKIQQKINAIQERDEYYHGHLYSMAVRRNREDDIMIFEK